MGEYGRKRVEETLAWHHEQPKLLHAYATLVELRRKGSGFLQGVYRLMAAFRAVTQGSTSE